MPASLIFEFVGRVKIFFAASVLHSVSLQYFLIDMKLWWAFKIILGG